jgi:hypothetical protein
VRLTDFRLARSGAAAAAVVLTFSAAPPGVEAATPVATFQLPAPSDISFATTATFGPDGLLYAYDGKDVLRQDALNVGAFTAISTADAPVTGSDAGPIAFTTGGGTIVVGTGFGGPDSTAANQVLTLPIAGGTFGTVPATVPGQFAFAGLPGASTAAGAANKLAVNQGTFTSSSVSYFDLVSGVNTPVVDAIPGASSEVAFGPDGRFYVGVGFDTDSDGAGPDTNHRGEVRAFDLAILDAAFAANTPVPFASGTLLNAANNNSGSGFFVSADGYLFVGAGNESGLITISPTGQVTSHALGIGFPALRYNATNDQFAAITFEGAVSVFDAAAFVPEPATVGVLVLAAAGVLLRRGRRAVA